MSAVGTGTAVQGWAAGSDDERVELIRRMVFQTLSPEDYPSVLFTARSIASRCQARDDWCELAAVYNAVKFGPIPIRMADGRVVEGPGLRFTTEPRQVDSYPSAKKTLEWLAEGANGEDCDGFVILIDSLLMVLGWLPGCCIASKDGREFVHIFPVVGFPKDNPERWMALEATEPSATVGWWPSPAMVKRLIVYGLRQDRRPVGREL